MRRVCHLQTNQQNQRACLHGFTLQCRHRGPAPSLNRGKDKTPIHLIAKKIQSSRTLLLGSKALLTNNSGGSRGFSVQGVYIRVAGHPTARCEGWSPCTIEGSHRIAWFSE